MLKKTNGISIFDLWDSHPINISLCVGVKLLLNTKKGIKYSYFSNFSLLINTKKLKQMTLQSISLKTQNTTEMSSVFLISPLTFDDRKQKEVVLMSALSRSTSCRPFSSVRPRYLPVVTWHSLNGWPQHVCLPLQLENIKRGNQALHNI